MHSKAAQIGLIGCMWGHLWPLMEWIVSDDSKVRDYGVLLCFGDSSRRAFCRLMQLHGILFVVAKKPIKDI